MGGNVGTGGILWQIKSLEKVCQPIGHLFSSTVSTPLNLLALYIIWGKFYPYFKTSSSTTLKGPDQVWNNRCEGCTKQPWQTEDIDKANWICQEDTLRRLLACKGDAWCKQFGVIWVIIMTMSRWNMMQTIWHIPGPVWVFILTSHTTNILQVCYIQFGHDNMIKISQTYQHIINREL